MQIRNDTCSGLASLASLGALDRRNHDGMGGVGVVRTDVGLRGASALTRLRLLQLTYSHSQPAWLEVYTAGSLTRLAQHQGPLPLHSPVSLLQVH